MWQAFYITYFTSNAHRNYKVEIMFPILFKKIIIIIIKLRHVINGVLQISDGDKVDETLSLKPQNQDGHN